MQDQKASKDVAAGKYYKNKCRVFLTYRYCPVAISCSNLSRTIQATTLQGHKRQISPAIISQQVDIQDILIRNSYFDIYLNLISLPC